MKISLIIPVYNEEIALERTLASIKNLTFPRGNFEVVFINDASKDSSKKVIEEFIKQNSDLQTTLINNETNLGRIKSRNIGVQNAKYDFLYFTDSRVLLDKDILSNIKRYYDKGELALIGNCIQLYEKPIGRFFYLVRKKLFKDWGHENFTNFYITNNNFDSASKGTGSLSISKDLFISSQPKRNDRNTNDDIRIIKNVINEKGKIYKVSDVKCYYMQRENLLNELKHTYERGPKFFDYYSQKGTRYFYLIYFSIILFFLSIILFFTLSIISSLLITIIIVLIGLLLLDLFALIWLYEKPSDIPTIIILFPILILCFLVVF